MIGSNQVSMGGTKVDQVALGKRARSKFVNMHRIR
jgi:hypothetical protein